MAVGEGSDVDADGYEEDAMVDAVEEHEHDSSGSEKKSSTDESEGKPNFKVVIAEDRQRGAASDTGAASSEAEESESEQDAVNDGSDVEYTTRTEKRSKSTQSEEEADEEGEEESEESETGSESYTEEAGAGRDSGTSSSASTSRADEDMEEAVASASSDHEDDSHSELEADPSTCVYCRYGEDEGPGSEADSQVYLTCEACGNRAHHFCAVANESSVNQDTWRCRTCSKKKPGSQSLDVASTKPARPRTSSSRILKDLLPVSRGIQKPGQHSVFAQLLLAEEDGNGPNLRKRKSPTGESSPVAEKRRRKATPKAASAERSLPGGHGHEQTSPSADELAEDTIVATQPSRISSRPSRRASLRHAIQPPPVATIEKSRYDKSQSKSLVLKFRVSSSRLDTILRKPPQPKSSRKAARKLPGPTPSLQAQSHRFPCLPTRSLIFPSIPQNHRDLTLPSHIKPYSGTLQPEESSTANTTSLRQTRDLFETARVVAEEERRQASQVLDGERTDTPAPPSSRPNKKNSNPTSKIERVQFGKYVIDSFYAAPYPEEFSHEKRLFICEYCLKYLPSQYVTHRHKLKCPAKHPPGDQIYVDGSVSVWEVDGRKKTEYCQCLCLMAKMFLGSKTLYYDVEPFLFYILTESDDDGYHFVGYFSKEKRPTSLNNVSCILVMPIHQRKGYATFLIDFSYLLTRIEGKEGSPEKPLSDMGLTAYRAYWDLTISKCLLRNVMAQCSVRNLMKQTGMTADDVMHTLERLYALVRDPVTGTYAIRFDKELYEKLVDDDRRRGNVKLNEDLLQWTPYLMGRSDAAHLESAPMQTVAPREGQEADIEDVASPPKASYMPDDPEPNGELLAKSRESEEDEGDPEPAEVVNGHVSQRDDRTPLVNGVDHSDDSEDSTPPPPSSSPVRPFQIQPSAVNEGLSVRPLTDTNPMPGPPPTSVLDTAVNYAMLQSPPELNDVTVSVTNGVDHASPSQRQNSDPRGDDQLSENDGVSGYALEHVKHEVPPLRYQIVPPIPTSVINAFNRTKSNRRRTGTSGFRPGMRSVPSALSTPLAGMPQEPLMPVRSSPRHRDGLASGLRTPNGSLGPSGSVAGSLRRGRSSGLKMQEGVERSKSEKAQDDEASSGADDSGASESEGDESGGENNVDENDSDVEADVEEDGEEDEDDDEEEEDDRAKSDEDEGTDNANESENDAHINGVGNPGCGL